MTGDGDRVTRLGGTRLEAELGGTNPAKTDLTDRFLNVASPNL